MLIYIYSASGVGSTTMGKTLAQDLGYDYVDIDDILFYKSVIPYTKRRSAIDRCKLFEEQLKDNLVVSGWFSDGIYKFIDRFDKIVFLYLDKETRIERIKLRELSKNGRRILENGDMRENFLEFIDWCMGYEEFDITKRSLALHLDFYEKAKCDKIKIDTKMSIEAYEKLYKFIKG